MRFYSPGPLVSSSSSANTRIHLAVADFDGDREDEFVLAYLNADETIHLKVYDTDSSRTPQFRTSINDEVMPATPVSLSRLALSTADFNNDGRAEIVLAFRDPSGGPGGDWVLSVKIYEVTDGSGNYNLQPRGKTAVHNEPAYNVGPVNMEVVTGDFDLDTNPEIAFLCSFFQGQQSGDDTFLYFLNVSEDLTTISFDITNRDARNLIGPNEMEPLSMSAGDLNSDGREELIYNIGSNAFVYELDSLLVPYRRGSIGGLGSGHEAYSYNFLTITDFDRDLHNEMVVIRNVNFNSRNPTQQFIIQAYGIDPTLSNFTLKAEIRGEELTPGNPGTGLGRHYAMIAGDFDGDKIRLGKPKRYFESQLRQPLVILNSPPVHFDMLNGQVHDVNICFGGNNCAHTATYSQSTTATGEMSTVITMDWGVDTTLTGEADLYGNSVKRSMTNSYGEGFSNDRSRRESFRINFSATAVAEDLIFGTVMDYVIWEYPVFSSDTLRGYVTVVEPKTPAKTWYSSESWTGNSYIPNHEPGNIWSYQEYNNLTSNDYLEEAVKLDNNVRFQLSPTSFFTWGVDWSSWSGTSVSRSKSIGTRTGFGWSAGLDIDFFGSVKSVYGEEMNSTYNEEEVSTHTSTIFQEIQIDVQLGTISSTDKRYSVTPYCYWANNGALVIDYAARPELAPPGFPETWWQQEYGHAPDPAFILPFKFHPEKGWPLADDTQRQFSKDIIFIPEKPQAGDTVRIAARVHNFSLLDTPAPLKVRFYLGDPDSGATPLISINGETEVFTNNFLPARGESVVQFDWQLPANIPNFPRIYALIDPDDEIPAEVHNFNNKAFNVLGSDIFTAIGDVSSPLIASFELHQNYPNPFNPETTIQYTLAQAGRVSLKVFDILGREVATLVEEQQKAGDYSVMFYAGNLASGMYFYRLESGGFIQTRKMLLVR
ncbi:MAG: T9SS type A sorting domain-containing protein [Calditrichia bacterium]